MELSRVAAADPKSFKVVLCDNTSRLSRDLSLSLDLIKKIKKNQVKVWFENPLADPEPERRLAGKSAMQSKPTRKRAKKRS
jgi:DNA invertase Pin-like site-specific DNA recombinase